MGRAGRSRIFMSLVVDCGYDTDTRPIFVKTWCGVQDSVVTYFTLCMSVCKLWQLNSVRTIADFLRPTGHVFSLFFSKGMGWGGCKFGANAHLCMFRLLCDAIWWNRNGSTWAQLMAYCPTAPSHHLNQCRFLISDIMWHSRGQFYTECPRK